MIGNAVESWDARLIDQAGPHSLVAIAREGRLVRETRIGPVHVQLTPVDEVALALVDLALAKQRDISFVYPAPAGEVSVLLAAQILLQRFLKGTPSPSVGIITADTVGAAHAWEGLRIAASGSRTRVSEAFPCFRATPEGYSPFGRRTFQGVLVGQRFSNWPVDVVVVDHLAGSVEVNTSVPAIHVFADPLDPALHIIAERSELVWGWTPGMLAVDGAGPTESGSELAPFSVAGERLQTIAHGVYTTIHVASHPVAEQCISHIRDDLRTLNGLFEHAPPPSVVRGLRVAWHHLSTLASLPCRPSDFDRFAGLPPIAARATASFDREIAAWAQVLPGDAAEIASVIASDLADLRAALDDANPYLLALTETAAQDIETLVIVRTHTAARGLLHGLGGNPDSDRFEHIYVRSVRRLHREGTWKRAVVVGLPPRWDWHRLASGLSPDLHFFVLGDADARMTEWMVRTLQEARCRWGSAEIRSKVWRELVGGDPPPERLVVEPVNDISFVASHAVTVQLDPFTHFEHLVLSSPLLIGDEGVYETVAEEIEPGTWVAAVEAVDVDTDVGVITLASSRVVDVRRGDRIIDCRADALEAGACLLIGRTEGRLGLLEAMAERLQKSRPDLFAASLLVSDAQATIRRAFRSSGMTRVQLHENLVALGFEKTYHAVRGYVGDGGPLAPRDIGDLHRLNQALELDLSNRHVDEIFAGVQRLRAFRRAAGKALAAAARGATITADMSRVDRETGLSLADLRDVVLEATVLEVRRRPELVALAELGRLERKN
jgi:hypothetical protein